MKIRKKWFNQLNNFLTNIVMNIIWHFFAGDSNQEYRQIAFSTVVGIVTIPHSLTHRRVCSTAPPLVTGEAYSLAGEGVGESQFRGGDVHCGILYIYVLYDACALPSLHASGDTKNKLATGY